MEIDLPPTIPKERSRKPRAAAPGGASMEKGPVPRSTPPPLKRFVPAYPAHLFAKRNPWSARKSVIMGALVVLVLIVKMTAFNSPKRSTVAPPVKFDLDLGTPAPVPSTSPAPTPTPRATPPPVEEKKGIAFEEAVRQVMAPPGATEKSTDTTENTYRVIGVSDSLNVRSGPGTKHPIVGKLKAGTTGISITGKGEMIGELYWVPISVESISGWVDGDHLIDARR